MSPSIPARARSRRYPGSRVAFTNSALPTSTHLLNSTTKTRMWASKGSSWSTMRRRLPSLRSPKRESKRPATSKDARWGAPAPDGAYAQWKAFVKENGIDASKVNIENVGFPVREPMLVAGKVDAITGYSFSSFLNLKSKGIAADQIRVLLMSDHGLDLYGNTVIVNPDFAAKHPEAVRGFIRATIKGWQETVANPEAAVEHVLKRNLIARAPVELERLSMCIADNVRTPYVQKKMASVASI